MYDMSSMRLKGVKQSRKVHAIESTMSALDTQDGQGIVSAQLQKQESNKRLQLLSLRTDGLTVLHQSVLSHFHRL